MRIAIIIVRVLLGLLLLFAAITFFFHLVKEPVFIGKMKIFNDGLKASVYLMPLVKALELLCGISLISGKFLRLMLLVLLPISLNILLVNVFMMPEGTPIAAALFLGNLFLIYANWNSYKHLFINR